MPNEVKNGLYALIIGLALISLSYWFVDKPVVYWMHDHDSRQYVLLDWFTKIPIVLVVPFLIIYPILTIRWFYKKSGWLDTFLLATGTSVTITFFFVKHLKFVFGRYWGDTWLDNNASLLRDNAYGFTWFNSSQDFASFPSGHIALTIAPLIVVWMLFPNLRWLAGLLCTLVAFGLIVLYYHFVSDVIAGALVGGLVGYYTVKISYPSNYASIR